MPSSASPQQLQMGTDDDGDDPVKAQLTSLNEARMAMQRVVNEQKLILERHRSGISASASVATARAAAAMRTTARISSSGTGAGGTGNNHNDRLMTPLRQATTRISPISSSSIRTGGGGGGGSSSSSSSGRIGSGIGGGSTQLSPTPRRLSPAEVVTTAVLQAHERKISSLKRQYEDLQHSVEMNRHLTGSALGFGDSGSLKLGSAGSEGPSNALLALQLKSATKTIESLEAKESRLREQLAQARADNLKLRGTVGQQTQQLRDSHEKFEALTKDHAELDDNHNKLMMQTKLALQGRISDLTTELDERSRDLKKLRLTLSEKDLAIQDLKMEVERLRKSKVEDAEVHEHERKQEVDQLKRRNKELQEALTSSQEQLARLVDLHKQVVKEKAKEAEFFEEAKAKLRKEAKSHELQSSAQKLKRELLEQSLEQADRSHQEEESEFYALRIEALQLRSKVTKLEKEKVWLEHSKKSELDAMAKRFDDKAVQLAAREQEVRVLKESLMQQAEQQRSLLHRSQSVNAAASPPHRPRPSEPSFNGNNVVAVSATSGPLSTYPRTNYIGSSSNGHSRPLDAVGGGVGPNTNTSNGARRFMTPSQRKALLRSTTGGRSYAYTDGYPQSNSVYGSSNRPFDGSVSGGFGHSHYPQRNFGTSHDPHAFSQRQLGGLRPPEQSRQPPRKGY